MVLDPSLVNDAIARAISYKRSAEYDKSLRIYESLFKEYGSSLTSGILVGWAKTLAVAGFYDEALQKYELAIKTANLDKEKEKKLVYTDQKERLLRREENKKEFEEWLKMISGNHNYVVQEEKEYIKELDDIDIFETDIKFNTDDLKKYEEYNDVLKDIIEKIKEYSNSIVNFENKIFDKSELDLKNWIYYFEDDIYLPRSFVLGECYFSENNYIQDLYVLIENANGESKVIEYITQPNKINIWNTFEFDFGVINIDFKGDYKFIDRRGKFLFGPEQYNGSTNRIFTYEGNGRYEFVDIEGKNLLFPSLKKPSYNMYHFVYFLGFFISNYSMNKEFYWRAINLLLLHESSLIYNNILSPFLIKELREKDVITDEEQNDLIDIWKNDKKYFQKVSQECTLNKNLNRIIRKTFDHFNIDKDILESIFGLAYDDYYAYCIYNKIEPLKIEDFYVEELYDDQDMSNNGFMVVSKNKDEFIQYFRKINRELPLISEPKLINFRTRGITLEEIMVPRNSNVRKNEKIIVISGKLKDTLIMGRVKGYTTDETFSVSGYWYNKPSFFDDDADWAFAWKYDNLPKIFKEKYPFENFLIKNGFEELEKFENAMEMMFKNTPK